MKRFISSVAIVTIGMLALAGCSAEGATDPTNAAEPDTNGTEEITTTNVEPHDYSVAAVLDQVPAPDKQSTFTISTADLSAATAAAGLERPTDSDADSLRAWIQPLTGAIPAPENDVPIFVPLAELFSPAHLGSHNDFIDELGFSLIDVETFVEYSAPPQRFTVLTGDFHDDTLASTLTKLDNGMLTAGEGDDFSIDPASRSAARPLGSPLRLATQPGLIAASPSTDYVSQWLTGSPTLGNNDDLAAVATALDEAQAVSATLHSGTPLLDARVHTVGIGWGVNDGSAAVTIIYVFESADAAANGIDDLTAQFADGVLFDGQKLSDVLTLEQTQQHDKLVVLSASVPQSSSPATVFHLFNAFDLPFAR